MADPAFSLRRRDRRRHRGRRGGRARSPSAASRWRSSSRTAARTERSRTVCRAGTWRCARRSTRRSASKLSRAGVHFVPRTEDRPRRRLRASSRDEWGFSAVVLACGAWRDRPLPIEGADALRRQGLIYQNPFIIWFNHADEAGYDGPRFEPRGRRARGRRRARVDRRREGADARDDAREARASAASRCR